LLPLFRNAYDLAANNSTSSITAIPKQCTASSFALNPPHQLNAINNKQNIEHQKEKAPEFSITTMRKPNFTLEL
jgi:hypothetical protein